MSFQKLGLEAELLRAIAAQDYDRPTPIQTKAIPVVLGEHDVLARAQTGTGKTAAFTLPMLQLLSGRPRPEGRERLPRALVLTPTRELATQVHESVRTYGQNLRMRSTVIFGGVGIEPQKKALRRGVDIVVATPGRLLDHAGQRTVDLSAIEILVLDEADRMLDMGFIHDIKRIMALLPERRQNLLFSATFSRDIERLADRLLHRPKRVEVEAQNTAAETVEQHIYRVEKDQKRDLLVHLIQDGAWDQVLVFTRTKHGANRLAKQLERHGIEAAAIHGNKSQGARTRALASFKAGQVRVLVATDIAARGLDIESLPHVVNYELPNVSEDYVHRIGRTGRAGEEGTAISLVSAEEVKHLRGIERLLRRRIPAIEVPVFTLPPAKPIRRAVPHQDPKPRQGRRRKANKKKAHSNARPGQARLGQSRPGQSRGQGRSGLGPQGASGATSGGPSPAGSRKRRGRNRPRRTTSSASN